MILPWPPSILNPNDRSHWRPKSQAKKKYRADCFYIAKMSPKKMHLKITFHPPDARHRDLDNCIASIKSGLDGVADAWGVNDRDFKLTVSMGEIIKMGAVRIS